MICQKTSNITSSKALTILVFYAHDGAYLVGFPKRQTVEALVDSIEDVYEQKTKRKNSMT